MEVFYTDERNIQIVIYVLKANNIRKVIVSPGATNVTFVASIQRDSFFDMYSCIDERSAAYMACGLAAETQEPVVLSCTGATASRNYVPGLTEAYYRKLPVIAITSSQVKSHLQNLFPQAIERSRIQNDIANISVHIPTVKDSDDEWFCEIQMNKAIHYLKKHGGGPIHINVETVYSENYSVKELPKCRIIRYVSYEDSFPALPTGQIGIFIGAHKKWSAEDSAIIDDFCKKYDAIVFYDHCSNYNGNFGVLFSLVGGQKQYKSPWGKLELLIHIGEISGDYYTRFGLSPKSVWRVSADGEIRDYFHAVSFVFEMSEKFFFSKYVSLEENRRTIKQNTIDRVKEEYYRIFNKMPELPFSNLYCAKKLSAVLPKDSIIHFGILNSLRSWNMFELSPSIRCYSNVGGFGIDGGMSSLIGAALSNRNKLYFGVFGDLAFFYDLNSLGNYNIRSNVRILLINNGLGVEFKKYDGVGEVVGSETNKYIAAEGHFGKKSPLLVKYYAESLGFKYLCASETNSFDVNLKEFVNPAISNKPIIFEVFTEEKKEYEALKIVLNIEKAAKQQLKQGIKTVVGVENIYKLRKILKK